MKKVRIIMSIAIIAMAGITLNSCDKSSTEPVAPATDNQAQSNILSQYNGEVLQHALAAYLQVQHENGNLKSGAEFIPAFFTNSLFGFFVDFEFYWDADCGCFYITSGEVAIFDTELDEDDFYRLNPDSTVSVHINSKTANAFYGNIAENTYAFGNNCNMTMNYTGDWVIVTYEWEGETYTYQFVDMNSNPSAVVWHGAGKVQFDGTGPKHNLVAHLTANPGWTNVNRWLNIN